MTGLYELDAIVIDGRSGSGKTSLADSLVRRLRGRGREAQLLRVEDLYPGWDGLVAGSRAVAAALAAGSYRRYDWLRGEFAEQVMISSTRPLIIEGCGAVTADNLAAVRQWVRQHGSRAAGLPPAARAPRASEASRARGAEAQEAVWSVWLDLPSEQRRSRALARDGDTFAPHWDRWAAQEDAHYAEHEPWTLVDEVLRG